MPGEPPSAQYLFLLNLLLHKRCPVQPFFCTSTVFDTQVQQQKHCKTHAGRALFCISLVPPQPSFLHKSCPPQPSSVPRMSLTPTCSKTHCKINAGRAPLCTRLVPPQPSSAQAMHFTHRYNSNNTARQLPGEPSFAHDLSLLSILLHQHCLSHTSIPTKTL